MLPAEGADYINDPIYFPKGHPVHLLVQVSKGNFDLIIVQPVAFAVSVVQHIQDRVAVTIAVVGWIIRHILPQLGCYFFHNITVLKKCVMLPLVAAKYKRLICPEFSTAD